MCTGWLKIWIWGGTFVLYAALYPVAQVCFWVGVKLLRRTCCKSSPLQEPLDTHTFHLPNRQRRRLCCCNVPLIHITGCVGNLMLVLDIFLGETNSERIFKIRTKTKLEMEQTYIS